ncbi:gamma carbonic anhydrase family protein [Oceanibacterium hippocampi]|uniref:UDP-3-O-[3-hydroxymyristoyl] glucosamine N-acyltransferase n=1 Tax=Oceanibacterium hippocampi TaxID=745714 RepID=A0A1Y5SPI8_9PROT|nr:gamma carbonic anhydrase family protein [Oceanibacterium hippocampi]SLN45401.1 UDP-3-O-[3-hydroxymyristoyl] glucosamine N-acyltransferase [Oceanibacterium hippocampi]
MSGGTDAAPVPSPLILPWRGKRPLIAADAFIAPSANIIGDVEIGAGSSVWFNVVIRADVHYVRIGANSNVQDGSVIHVTTDRHPTIIGDNVLVGHLCMLHGCRIEDGGFVGMNATVMDDAVVESGAMVAAGSLVTPGTRVEAGGLWGGRPAKRLRDLRPEEIANLTSGAEHYAELAARYRDQLG